MRKLLCLLIPFCMGCLWDRDTLKEEGKDRMGAVKVIVGWFDRYPPEYYQARLDRVLKELETKPNELSLYDDAGVALDRLHRSNEAIAIMARKKAMMEKLKGSSSEKTLWEHQYRYLANLGTFYVHRWIGREKEARDADLSDLAKAEELIAAVIEHNPDAHFGREKYQLIAIQWLQKKPDPDLGEDYIGHMVDPYELRHSDKEIEEALKGFLGMIKLGSAWESTDFFNTIAKLNSAESRGILAYLASLRVQELSEAGRSSLHPHPGSLPFHLYGSSAPGRKGQVKDWFIKTRKAADQRQESRWTYLREGIAEGRHPDTDPNFWKNWKEPKFPDLPGMSFRDFASSEGLIIVALITSVSFFTMLWIISALRRRRKKHHLQSIEVVGMKS